MLQGLGEDCLHKRRRYTKLKGIKNPKGDKQFENEMKGRPSLACRAVDRTGNDPDKIMTRSGSQKPSIRGEPLQFLKLKGAGIN